MFPRLRSFLQERVGPLGLSRGLLDVPVTGGARWSRALGAVLLVLLVLEFVSGVAMMTVYAPSTQTAWGSVFYLQHHFAWGGMVRGMHHWAAQILLLVAAGHLLRAVIVGGYRRPREVTWWSGLLLLGVLLAFAHTGALLPWDQGGYWTARVEAGITGTVPVVGEWARRFILGGQELGTLSLTRLYAAHVGLLPPMLVAIVALHLWLHHRHAALPPSGANAADDPRDVRVEAYWPSQAVRDALLALLVVGIVAYLARRLGAPLDAPADPSRAHPARPEWYLLPLYEIRKHVPARWEVVATAAIPALGGVFLMVLPWLDRSRTGTTIRRRLPVIAPAFLLVGGFGFLTAVSMAVDRRDPAFRRARAEADQRARRAMQLAAGGIPLQGPLEMMRNDPLVRPRELFDAHCASCHAPPGAPLHDARGRRTQARGPALEGFGTRAWARALLNDPQADALFGRTGIDQMPPQHRRLGEQGMSAVVEYLYAQSIEPGDPPADADLVRHGDEIYHRRCTGCHQGTGDQSGAEAEERLAPDLTGWGSRSWIREQIVRPAAPEHYGRTGNEMPAFADELQGQELEWVVDHVRALRQSPAPAVPPAPIAVPAGG